MKKIIKIFLALFFMLYSTKSFCSELISHIPENPNKALIMLHGWHQSGRGVSWLTDRLKNDFQDTAFYYPTAPDNAPGGGYQWFVIPGFGSSMSEEKIYGKMMSSALDNVEVLYDLIDDIHKTQNIDYENIHIAGFSQGGFMAILAGLTNNEQIGKVISFSGVPILFTKDFKNKDIISKPEILIIQGDNDQVIPIDSFSLTEQTLKSVNVPSTVKLIKNMPHIINSQALDYFIEFLKN